jgi:hypothetical protein
MFENIFKATPAEIDIESARLRNQADELVAKQQWLNRRLRDEDTGPVARADAHRRIQEFDEQHEVLVSLIIGLRMEFDRRGGWTRLYVVDNSNGHAHRTTACSTTYANTSFHWFPEHSGKTDEEIVALTGAQTCLVCFGSQREAIEAGRPSKLETPNQAKAREDREAQAAKTAAKKVKAAENAITDVDGSLLYDDDHYVIKTLRTAQIKAVQALEQSGRDEIYADQTTDPAHASRLLRLSGEQRAYASRLVVAIAAKQERSLAEVLDEITTKAEKKLAPAQKDEAARKAAGKTAEEWYRI